MFDGVTAKSGYTKIRHSHDIYNMYLFVQVLSHGLDTKIRDEKGRIPLFRAVEQSNTELELIKVLIKHGEPEEVNMLDNTQTHMLMFPLMRSSPHAARLASLLLTSYSHAIDWNSPVRCP